MLDGLELEDSYVCSIVVDDTTGSVLVGAETSASVTASHFLSSNEAHHSVVMI